MKLLLTSAGFTNKSIAGALLKLAGKPFKDLNLVFIPTAANIVTGGKEFLIRDLYQCKKLGLHQIEITDIAAVSKTVWQPQLEGADVIMVGGGHARYLLEQIKKSGLDKLLPDLLKTRVYASSSAGGMVIGRSLAFTTDVIDRFRDTGKLTNDRGLGWVNFSLRPHFASPDFPTVTEKILAEMAKKITEPVYAIDDNSAIVVDGDNISVVSEGKWKKFN